MTTRFVSLLLIVLLGADAFAQLGKAPTFLVEKFDIGGDGGAEYLAAEPSTGRVFVTRQTHVMVVDGRAGTILGEIPNTPGVRGVALALRWGRGFTTNAGDSTVTMFDMATLATIKKIKIPSGGLAGIVYDAVDDRIILTNRSRPKGTVTILNPKDGTILGSVTVDGNAPSAAAEDDRGRIYVSNTATNAVHVIDLKSLKVVHTWPVAPCVAPTGVDYDMRTGRLFVGCSKRSVVLDASNGKVVSSFENGDGVDGLAWDAADYLMYIPAGRSGTITVVRMVSPNSYKVVATVKTVPGAKTIAHDPSGRVVYQFQPENGKNWLVRVSR